MFFASLHVPFCPMMAGSLTTWCHPSSELLAPPSLWNGNIIQSSLPWLKPPLSPSLSASHHPLHSLYIKDWPNHFTREAFLYLTAIYTCGRYYYPHSTRQQTEAQRDNTTFPRSYSLKWSLVESDSIAQPPNLTPPPTIFNL